MTYKLSDRVSPLLVVAVQAGPIHPSLQWSFKGRRRSDHSARTVNIIFPGTCPHWWARSSLEMIIIWLFNKVNWGRWKELSTAGYLQRHQQRFSCSLSIPSSKNEALSSWNVECAVISTRQDEEDDRDWRARAIPGPCLLSIYYYEFINILLVQSRLLWVAVFDDHNLFNWLKNDHSFPDNLC